MSLIDYLSFIFPLITVWWMIYLFLPFFKSQLIDIPNERSSHKKNTPKGGGILFSTIANLEFKLDAITLKPLGNLDT